MDGGGGDFYDRENTSRRDVDDRLGYSTYADRAFRKPSRKIAPELNPKNRLLSCPSKGALVLALDVTRSVGRLPKVFFDKMPMIAGQLVMQKYLGEDLSVSLAAVGDIYSDSAPLQIADFAKVRNLDERLTKMWIEYRGG